MMIKQVLQKIIVGTFYFTGFIAKDGIKPHGPFNIFCSDIKFPDTRINMINYLSEMGCIVRIKIVPFLNTHINSRFIIGLTNVAF